jgi:hypothetical protein
MKPASRCDGNPTPFVPPRSHRVAVRTVVSGLDVQTSMRFSTTRIRHCRIKLESMPPQGYISGFFVVVRVPPAAPRRYDAIRCTQPRTELST